VNNFASFKNFIWDEWDKSRALKRCADVPIAFDDLDAEERYLSEPIDPIANDRYSRDPALHGARKRPPAMREDTTGDFDAMAFPAREDSVKKIKDIKPAAEIVEEMMSEAARIIAE
jgi:hypothetical protein